MRSICKSCVKYLESASAAGILPSRPPRNPRRTVLCFPGVSPSLVSKSWISQAYSARASDALDHSSFFIALLVSGVDILISHPRFYWGEVGNSRTTPLFKIPMPSSRATVPTAYGYVLPDQNGWSRYLHFEAAWAFALTGLVYVIFGLWTRHSYRNLGCCIS